ncbi:Endonuclease 1 [[Mycoplasma] phocae]|uniref:Endonuclease 1 n=2 Tax=[Mycoplasma] phocae TaxID=142651 RepID=A0A2Z5IQP3_9BACT|nr:Endonuclease 1 [[Mycoplasma] phocae]
MKNDATKSLPKEIKTLEEFEKYGDNILNILVKDQDEVINRINAKDKLFFSFSSNKLAFNNKKPSSKDEWNNLNYIINLKTKVKRGLQLASSKKSLNGKRINSELDYEYDATNKLLTIKYKLAKYNGQNNNPDISEKSYQSQIRLDRTKDDVINISDDKESGQSSQRITKRKISSSSPILDSKHQLQYDSKNEFYKNLDGLSGEQLRSALFQVQKSHREANHDYNGLFKIYKDVFVDKYYENDGTVLDIYGENPKGDDPFVFRHGEFRDVGNSEGQGMNREHLIPQSWWNRENPMRVDAHHVWPTDKTVNAKHGNLPYGTVRTPKYTSKNGTLVGISEEDGQEVTEVIDEFKGDVARAHLYFVLTYRDKNLEANGNGKRFFEKINNEEHIRNNFLGTMLNWAYKDNISQFDLDRNNGIYKHQKNRNPFIDYPELIKVYFENDNNFVFKNKGVAINLQEIN